MPNIYLRLPQYVAAFYRNRDEDNQLSPFQPVEFPPFTHEAVVIAASLMLADNTTAQSALCYSQRAWNKILQGRSPVTGKKILNRETTDWPTNKELCTLRGKALNDREASFDYLCIAIPREIAANGKIHRTNASYTLAFSAARKLASLMRNEFYHVFADWCIQDRRHCNMVGIKRERGEMLERFLAQYDIPISADEHEKDSLRRMANRWFERASIMPNDRLNFNASFLRHISEEEREKEERRRKRMKVKTDVKE